MNSRKDSFLADVIPPNEIGVKFDDVGALENVKDTLKELVMLPLQRPELFSKGQLRKKKAVMNESTDIRPINMNDFKYAREQVSASMLTKSMNMNGLLQWNELYGEGGSRKKTSW
ncbi:Peroxisomal biogenesis factor 6 [Camellia lanceoleosa]|uniref:Peroxisomal biogenesis factor 6 n=1 Tax=Camellia lanceoleosa TaxID=1840588 RepID=A0ACC0F9W8_9ERIC|nr:Peroxisomal biogenesis factor 6 [Camellia lanceoleosa]